MTARNIAATLLKRRFAKGFALPNYTPDKWYECDVWHCLPSGYSCEYEIKLSHQDFDADATKRRMLDYLTPDPYTKHERLENPEGALWSPNRFTFVTPEGLLDLHMIPEWAGWSEILSKTGDGLNLYEVPRKKAPLRHSMKVPEGVLKHAHSVCYWRMHKLLQERRLEG